MHKEEGEGGNTKYFLKIQSFISEGILDRNYYRNHFLHNTTKCLATLVEEFFKGKCENS